MKKFKIFYLLLILTLSSPGYSEVYVDSNGYIVDTNNLKTKAESNIKSPPQSVSKAKPELYVDQNGYIVTNNEDVKKDQPKKQAQNSEEFYLPSLPPNGFPNVSTTPEYTEKVYDASKSVKPSIVKNSFPDLLPKKNKVKNNQLSQSQLDKIDKCLVSINEMNSKRNFLQANLSNLNQTIDNNRWIKDRVLLAKVGLWNELKNIYQWTDIFNVEFRESNLDSCLDATQSMISFYDLAINRNIIISNSIAQTNESEFKIQLDTKCRASQNCDVYFSNYLNSIIKQSEYLDFRQLNDVSARLRTYMNLFN